MRFLGENKSENSLAASLLFLVIFYIGCFYGFVFLLATSKLKTLFLCEVPKKTFSNSPIFKLLQGVLSLCFLGISVLPRWELLPPLKRHFDFFSLKHLLFAFVFLLFELSCQIISSLISSPNGENLQIFPQVFT